MESKRSFTCVIVLLGVIATLPAAAAEPDREELPKGRIIWGLGASAALSTGDLASGFGSAQVRLDRVISHPRGAGLLRGQLAYAVELVPLFLLSQGEPVYASGFNLLGRHYFEGGGAVRPFLTLGAGLLVSSRAIPEGVSRVNFTPQIGGGLLFVTKAHLYAFEVRLHHLSNGGRVMPNPGINSVMFQFAVNFPRPRPKDPEL